MAEEAKIINKVVLGWKEGMGSIGVQATGCDPYFKIQAVPSIEDLVARVPEALEEAQARWSEVAQNPAYQRPALQGMNRPAAPKSAPTPRRGRQTPAPQGQQQMKL